MADEVIVLVGGFGTRLRAVVSDVPKPLAPVAGRPFLGWLLDRYAETGMRRVILATGHGAGQVREFAGQRWNGMEIAYSHEDAPLGTGGALRQAVAMLAGDGVHLANGDTFLRYQPQTLQRVAESNGAHIGVALARVEDVARYGAVEVVDGRVVGFHEKGGRGAGLINAGSYYLDGQALAALPARESFSFEVEVLVPAAAAGHVTGCSDTSDFIDIGVPEDYRRAQSLFGQGDAP